MEITQLASYTGGNVGKRGTPYGDNTACILHRGQCREKGALPMEITQLTSYTGAMQRKGGNKGKTPVSFIWGKWLWPIEWIKLVILKAINSRYSLILTESTFGPINLMLPNLLKRECMRHTISVAQPLRKMCLHNFQVFFVTTNFKTNWICVPRWHHIARGQGKPRNCQPVIDTHGSYFIN